MPPNREAGEITAESQSENLVLAVDAGGTKTAAWLVDTDGNGGHRILGRSRSTSGNPTSVGFAEATRVIAGAVRQAQTDANRPNVPVPRAIFSIAGSLDPAMRDRFINWAHSVGVAREVAIVSDVLPVLAAGAEDCCGVALIAGTGSFAFVRAADGRTAHRGGWGFLLGDEGSGYAIGRAALQHALEDMETNAPRGALTDAVLNALQVNSIRELTTAIYKSPDPRSTVAAIAPLVIAAADRGDQPAQMILSVAAQYLAELVARTAAAVGFGDAPLPLAVGGGVLVGSKRLQDELRGELDRLKVICKMQVVEEPLDGCVRLAAPEFAGTLVTWH